MGPLLQEIQVPHFELATVPFRFMKSTSSKLLQGGKGGTPRSYKWVVLPFTVPMGSMYAVFAYLWGDFKGQCWQIVHTWSIWDLP